MEMHKGAIKFLLAPELITEPANVMNWIWIRISIEKVAIAA